MESKDNYTPPMNSEAKKGTGARPVPASAAILCLVGAAIGLGLGARLLPFASQEIFGGVAILLTVFAIGFAWAVGLALAGGAMAGGRALRCVWWMRWPAAEALGTEAMRTI
jgi:hypothetical protein